MKATEAIFEYGLVLVRHTDDLVADAENLPLSKDEMKTILVEKMKGAAHAAQREAMKAGYLGLARFQADFDNRRAWQLGAKRLGIFRWGSKAKKSGSDGPNLWSDRVCSEEDQLRGELNRLGL